MKKRLTGFIRAAAMLSAAAFVVLCGCGKGAGDTPEKALEAESAAGIEAAGEEAESALPAMIPVETQESGTEKDETETEGDGSFLEVPDDPSGSPSEETAEETEEKVSDPVFTAEEIPDDIFQKMLGVSYPEGCSIAREDLRYLRLSYYDFNGEVQVGEMVCSRKIADDLIEIFRGLYEVQYPIERMRLIDEYGGDDDASCADNNTSCFNYRTVAGSTNLTKHALGVAVDVNPFYNPYVTYPQGVERITPPGSEAYADRSADFPHKIGPGDPVYELFVSHGFTWGGNWKSVKDYQHFQKNQ